MPPGVRGILLQLLRELDEVAEGSPRVFYDRVCEGVCALSEIERCALLLYEAREKRVLPAGSHGLANEMLEQMHGTLEETPIAARALAEDRVVVTAELDSAVAPRHQRLPGVNTLACVPVRAGDRWLGIMLCDRGGGEFTLTEEQKGLMWSLGKTAALAATTRIAISQQERAKLLSERVALAREVHDRVIQRLFGISLVLGSEEGLSAEEQQRVAAELQAAIGDLRAAMQRNVDPAPPRPSKSFRLEAERLSTHYPDQEIVLAIDPEVDRIPEAGDGLAQSVLAEALHNAEKHAKPEEIEVEASVIEGTLVIEIRNDGAGEARGIGTGGMGLRLAAFEVLQAGGLLEFGPAGAGTWRVRLVLPLDEGNGAGG